MGDEIRFILGGEMRRLGDVDPTRTVLTYLREVERRCGTKEGCAEGDCGACTVVLGELDGKRLRYRAVNACLLFTATLDGKQLITIEDLEGPDGTLHPAQQAMIDHHGSQCGFCTPGFVMSQFALFHSEAEPTEARINDVLAGNLCRCTGYRPIVAATRAMYKGGTADRFSEAEAATVRKLKTIRRDRTLDIASHGRRFLAPRSVDALAGLLVEHPGARLLAGGTDLGLLVTKQHRDFDLTIYTGAIDEMRTVSKTRTHIEIGGAATYTAAAAAIAEAYPDFGEVVRRIGSVPIRNAGTLAGNIANASPIGDTPPLLIALGASMVLRRGGDRREVALDAFFTGYRETVLAPGEFIETIRLPLPAAGSAFAAYKVSKRFDQDISAVCAAFHIAFDEGRIAAARVCYGGMATTPKRAANCERLLTGEAWVGDTVRRAMAALGDDFAPISDMRASAGYRLAVARNLLWRFYLETGESGVETRLLKAHG